MGSFWYLKVYYILTVLGALIIRFFPHHIYWFIALTFGLTMLFNIFPHYYPTGQVGYVAFYLGVFLIGHKMRGKKIPTPWIPFLYAGVTMALGWMFWYYGGEMFYKLNKQKFPPKLPYIIWLLFCLVTLFVGYNRLKITKPNFINYIGTNAIFYYFGQGISSSLIYFLVIPLKGQMSWWLILPMIFLANVLLAVVIAELVKKLDAVSWRILEFLRKKTSSE